MSPHTRRSPIWQVVAEALLVQIHARSDDQRLELEFMWRLGESGTVETILSLLRHAMLPEQLAQVAPINSTAPPMTPPMTPPMIP